MDGGRAAGEGPTTAGRVESLLVECLEVIEHQGRDAVEGFLARHAEEAPALRRRLAILGDLGLGDRQPDPVPPFERIEDFRLIRRIGRGGMSNVWLAEQVSLRRLVALKLLHAQVVNGESAARARREAQAIAGLAHPNIVAVHGCGEHQGVFWIAMQLVEGQGLDELLRQRRPATALVLRWAIQLADALHASHRHGIVHRDVKPSNVCITRGGDAMLLDFGLARFGEAGDLTRAGEYQGSPHYSAPEQIDDSRGQVSPRTDVFALGATLYECLTGRVPFRGERIEQIFQAVLSKEPIPPRRLVRQLPRDLETVVLTCLEKDPDARYADAAELREDLEGVRDFRGIRARPPGWFGRGLRLARRNRVAAAAMLVAVVAAPVAWVATARGARLERQRSAHAVLAAGQLALAEYRAERERLASAVEELLQLRATSEARHYTLAEDRRMTELEGLVEASRRRRELRFAEVLEASHRAETFAPELVASRRLRAELFLKRWREAVAAKDPADESFYRSLVESADGEREMARELHAMLPVRVDSRPSGAEVLLFAFAVAAELEGGRDRRRVFVPARGAPPPVAPGSWGLRVVRAAAGLEPDDVVLAVAGHPIEGSVLVAEDRGTFQRGDRLLSIDGAEVVDEHDVDRLLQASPAPPVFETQRGASRSRHVGPQPGVLGVAVATPGALAEAGGVQGRVFRNGSFRDLVLPAGAELRTTAAPLLVTPEAVVGTTPIQLELAPGRYLAVLRGAGCAAQRLVFEVPRTGRPVQLEQMLLPTGALLPGFVEIPVNGFDRTPQTPTAFAIQEREVTAGEYLRFVNEVASVDAARAAALAPSIQGPSATAGDWLRAADGSYRFSAGWRADLPMHGVTWRAATAYAEWFTARMQARGVECSFRLPTFQQWIAAQGIDRYCFGDSWRSRWVKSCFARATPCIEPVLRFPIDESAYGVRDLAGSVCEWLQDWFWEAKGQRRFAGGSWAHARARYFETDGVQGQLETWSSETVGFRLVALR